MNLEIKVFEEVTVTDSVGDVLRILEKAINAWIESNDTKPFTVVITKLANSPPALGISVGETVAIKDKLV